MALRRGDGSRVHVEVTGSQFNSGGNTLAIVTIRDVTARMAAEEQLRQSQKLQAIGKLTGGVAHDFNNLLAVISGNLELANEALAGGNAAVRRLLDPARRAAERGSTLTRSLLSFARQQPLRPQVADLNAQARDTTELLRRTLPPNIDIEFAGGAGLWPCEVDSGQLQNALLNLVVNSRDAMPDGGRPDDRDRQRRCRRGRRRHACRTVAWAIMRGRWRYPTPGSACRRTCWSASSSRSSRPKPSAKAPAWASAWSTASPGSRAVMSR